MGPTSVLEMSIALLLLGPALADDLVADISHEHSLSMQGLWPIPIHTEIGWMLGIGQGGGFSIGGLEVSNWSVENRHEISPRVDLKDHSLARCLDGSWLHLSSAGTHESNLVFHDTEGFGLIGEPVDTGAVDSGSGVDRTAFPADGVAESTVGCARDAAARAGVWLAPALWRQGGHGAPVRAASQASAIAA